MFNKLKSLLTEAGLSESEVAVYLELLKKPSHTKWDLVARTGFDKNKVYRAFDRLRDLNMIDKIKSQVEALSLEHLAKNLEYSHNKTLDVAERIRKISSFLKVPAEAVEEFEVITDKERILDRYIMMSEVPYNTCLDFGDLESFVPVVGGMAPLFKFRLNRYNQHAKNRAVCTTIGPCTACIARKNDMQRFKSNIEFLKIDFKGKWIIFSDTNDYVMFNYCAPQKIPSTVFIKSKVVADIQRAQFDQFYENVGKFN